MLIVFHLFSSSWINGHTDRFNCLVNHDGIFDTKNGFYATEELYFPEHEVLLLLVFLFNCHLCYINQSSCNNITNPHTFLL